MRRFLILLATLPLLGLAGCAGAASGPPSPTPAPTPTTAAPSPTPTPSPSSLAVATKEFCRTTIEHSSEGLDAILKLVENPDGKGLETSDFSNPRTDLVADEKIAPAELKTYLRKQIKILGTIVDVFEGEGNDTIDTGGYRDASADFLLACGEQVKSVEEPTEEPATWTPKPKDFKVGIKVLSKECFGSAGCIIDYKITLDYLGSQDLPTDGTTDITYAISGAEGPIIGTVTLDSEGKFDLSEESADTTSSSKKLVAKVTEVDYNEFG